MLAIIDNYPIIMILLYLVIGFIAGFLPVFVGGGGVFLILPSLTFILMHVVPKSVALKLAIGTSLASIIVMSSAGVITLIRLGHKPDLRYCLVLLPFLIVGGLIGPHITMLLPVKILHFCIGATLILFALYKQFLVHKTNELSTVVPLNPKILMLVCSLALLAGVVCNATGVPTSVFLISSLIYYMPYRVAVNTNMILAIPSAVVGTCAYAFFSGHVDIGTPWHIGYVYLPAFICFFITIIIGANVGGRLVSKVSTKVVQRIFYIYLIIAGVLLVVA